jgi:hypothetical protein
VHAGPTQRHVRPQRREACASGSRWMGAHLQAHTIPAVVEGKLVLAAALLQLARVRGELEVHGLVSTELDLSLVERTEAAEHLDARLTRHRGPVSLLLRFERVGFTAAVV